MDPVLSLPTSVTILPFRGNVAGPGLELRRRRIASILPHFSGLGKQVRPPPDVGLDDERNRMVDVQGHNYRQRHSKDHPLVDIPATANFSRPTSLLSCYPRLCWGNQSLATDRSDGDSPSSGLRLLFIMPSDG